MKNLVIGNTSQQSHYYPNDYQKISSRNVDLNYLRSVWDSVYITFADQRVRENNVNFLDVNFHYTKKILDVLVENCNRIIFFATCDLWNNCDGQIDINTKFNFSSNNGYIKSKLLMINYIKESRKNDERYNKINIIYPFYFNSVYRNKYFLFGKIFNSIINKEKINIGNINFNRDMVHTSYMVKRVIESIGDVVIGAGRLFNIDKYLHDLYEHFGLDFDYYVTCDNKFTLKKRSDFYSKQYDLYTYEMLLSDTIKDIDSYTSCKARG